jgi:chromate transporter
MRPADPVAATTAGDAGAALASPQSPRELFTAFTSLALQGFGGVLPMAQRELVDKRRWLTQEQFLELLSVGQVLPGPNVVNLALMIGDRFFGWRGAVATLAGILLAPFLIVVLLAVLYGTLVDTHPAVAGALRGMAAAAAGLLLAMTLKLSPALGRNPVGWPAGLVFAVATALAVGVARWPLAGVVLGVGATSVAWAWWRLSRQADAARTGPGR